MAAETYSEVLDLGNINSAELSRLCWLQRMTEQMEHGEVEMELLREICMCLSERADLREVQGLTA